MAVRPDANVEIVNMKIRKTAEKKQNQYTKEIKLWSEATS